MKRKMTVHFSSQSPHWATPAGLYAELDAEFGFTFDPCPLRSDIDGLSVSWGGAKGLLQSPVWAQRSGVFSEGARGRIGGFSATSEDGHEAVSRSHSAKSKRDSIRQRPH